jgi:tyrosyl-tRNA synthetase
MPLLEGLDGQEKMSKSLGNAIGLTEIASEAFGKLMSISDKLMWRYYKLLLNKTDHEIDKMQLDVSNELIHPMNLKKEMALKIVSKFWSKEEAENAKIRFEEIFQKKNLQAGTIIKIKDLSQNIWIVDLLKALQAIDSSSQARRLIEAGAVLVDNILINDFKAIIDWKTGTIIKVGKHRIYVLEETC